MHMRSERLAADVGDRRACLPERVRRDPSPPRLPLLDDHDVVVNRDVDGHVHDQHCRILDDDRDDDKPRKQPMFRKVYPDVEQLETIALLSTLQFNSSSFSVNEYAVYATIRHDRSPDDGHRDRRLRHQ